MSVRHVATGGSPVASNQQVAASSEMGHVLRLREFAPRLIIGTMRAITTSDDSTA
jgi:hypothetical protein